MQESGYAITARDLAYSVNREKVILSSVNFDVPPGAFVAVLGENGAGKTTLLDLAMGFRGPTGGSIEIGGSAPHLDPWETRRSIAYLSEKMDLPGDWSVSEFLKFNRAFYPGYSAAMEAELSKMFRVDTRARVGNLSAGEIRRVQVVGALSIQPKLVIVDEITAVLDIVGRQRFLRLLSEMNRQSGCTVLLATNILEDLAEHASHVCLVAKGKVITMETLSGFLGGADKQQFSKRVVERLETP